MNDFLRIRTPEERKKEAEISRRQLIREYDLFYLQLMKTLYKFRMFAEMRRHGHFYKYNKFILTLPQEVINTRLRPTGETCGIMLIGTNPGTASSLHNAWDDPFGKYLQHLIQEAGLNKDDLWTTNLYKFKTENNRPLNDKEIESGWKELQLEIPFVEPTVIGCFGAIASARFGLKINEEGSYKGIPVVTMNHPSYLRRNSNDMELRSKFINRLKLLKEYHDKSTMDSGYARRGSIRGRDPKKDHGNKSP